MIHIMYLPFNPQCALVYDNHFYLRSDERDTKCT